VSVYDAPPQLRMREAVPGVLLQDIGFDTALIRDPALYRRFYPTVEYRPPERRHVHETQPRLGSMWTRGIEASP
jgi:hypothetical protein